MLQLILLQSVVGSSPTLIRARVRHRRHAGGFAPGRFSAGWRVNPMMTIRMAGEGYEGFLVIDSLVGDTSSGGVRICDDLSIAEIAQLAHEMSCKYALFRLPRGGAKAGVRLEAKLDRAQRLQALRAYGSKLGPMIRKGLYYPGMDMNCGPEELRAIYAGAGMSLGEVTDTSWFTALSAFHALEATVEAMGVHGRPVSIAIEGFGSVARHLAARLPGTYRIAGVATITGAVLVEDGHAPASLVDLRDRYGDDFVQQLQGARVGPRELLEADVDVLVPAARTGTLTQDVASRLRARAVVPIANAPYQDGVVQTLRARGVVCLPGFVVNVGGVLASSLFDQGVRRRDIEAFFAGPYRQFVGRLLRAAQGRGVSAVEYAQELVQRQLDSRREQRRRTFSRRVYDRFLRPRLPRTLQAAAARRGFTQAMQTLLAEVEVSESP